MKLVINSNRIIAALIKDSLSRKIILEGKLDLLTINYSEQDIEKYKREILFKSKLTENQFDFINLKLREKFTFLDDMIVQGKMEDAKKIMEHIDENDAPFIAAALATNSDIWSDDKHFNKQNKVKIWKTKEIAKMLGLSYENFQSKYLYNPLIL